MEQFEQDQLLRIIFFRKKSHMFSSAQSQDAKKIPPSSGRCKQMEEVENLSTAHKGDKKYLKNYHPTYLLSQFLQAIHEK